MWIFVLMMPAVTAVTEPVVVLQASITDVVPIADFGEIPVNAFPAVVAGIALLATRGAHEYPSIVEIRTPHPIHLIPGGILPAGVACAQAVLAVGFAIH
jgi:hypothetical protein